MNSESFVNAIKKNVSNSSVTDTIKIFENPPGRKPKAEIIELSLWYKSLTGDDKAMLMKALKYVADSSAFGFLTVLDGVRIIENGREKGQFELYYTNGTYKALLNDPKKEYLHDIFNGLQLE